MQEILNIENQKILCIKGVEKAISSTPTQTVLQTEKSKVLICGNNLEIKKLDIENKEAIIDGEIYSVKFIKKMEKKSFLKRIFK